MKQIFIKLKYTVLLFLCFTIKNTVAQSDSTHTAFYNAYSVLQNMLEGKDSLDFEKAVFVTENAYYNNQYDFNDFKRVLDYHTNIIRSIAKQAEQQKADEYNKLKIYEKKMFHLNALNWAIYEYITDTITIQSFFYTRYKMPYAYSSSDPYGTSAWEHTQVIPMLTDTNAKANCYALAVLFKLFSDRLNSDARFVTTPHHIYIQNRNSKGDYKNVELAMRAFPGDGSIQALTYTTHETIVRGMAQQPLNTKQSIVLNLIYLAKGFQYKFNDNTNDFLSQCASLAIKHDSLSINAILLKTEITENRLFQTMKQNKLTTLAQAKTNAKTKALFLSYEKQINHLYTIGYREIPNDIQHLLLSAMQGNKDGYITTDKTPKPFTSIGKVARYVTLSGGLFDEMHYAVDTINYFHASLQTKKKKIIDLLPTDTVKNRVDPVVFAMSIDPLFAKFPHQSPYAFVGNSPILNVEFDGRDYGVYINHTTKTIIVKATFYTAKSDENSYISAVKATEYWNNQSGKFQYRVETDKGYSFYDVTFDIKVDNTKESPEIDVTKDVMTSVEYETGIETTQITKTGGAEANLYSVVPDGTIKQNSMEKHTVGTNLDGYKVSVQESHKSKDTGPHEVGHGLGINHLTNTIMSEAINQNHKSTPSESVIGAILTNVGIGGTKRTDYVNKNATGTLNEQGKAPNNFKTGKIVTK